ncbi:hypothetical protein ABTM87_19085, partial [Acinetobacter baumannii]
MALALGCIAVAGAKWLGFDGGTIKALVVEGAPALEKYTRPAWQDMPRVLRLLAETVAMGVAATLLTMALSIPSVFFAVRNNVVNSWVFAFS